MGRAVQIVESGKDRRGQHANLWHPGAPLRIFIRGEFNLNFESPPRRPLPRVPSSCRDRRGFLPSFLPTHLPRRSPRRSLSRNGETRRLNDVLSPRLIKTIR